MSPYGCDSAFTQEVLCRLAFEVDHRLGEIDQGHHIGLIFEPLLQ